MTEGESCEVIGDSENDGETTTIECEADTVDRDYHESEESYPQDTPEECKSTCEGSEGEQIFELYNTDQNQASTNHKNNERIGQDTLEKVIINEAKENKAIKTSDGRVIFYLRVNDSEVVIYEFPFPSYIEKIIGNPTGKYAHGNFPRDRYATDFLLPINTPILAARDGKVVGIKEDSDKWGLDIKLADEVNEVVIAHRDGTYAHYAHFGKYRVKVRIGQQVQTGDLLGYSGLSGCMSEPHLHFNVFKIENGKPISIPVRFSERSYTPKEALIHNNNYSLLKAA